MTAKNTLLKNALNDGVIYLSCFELRIMLSTQ
jgi:hypothetical protein